VAKDETKGSKGARRPKPRQVRARYDQAFKRICKNEPQVIASYLEYMNDSQGIIEKLDLTTMKEVSSELVSDRLVKRQCDIIWQVNYKSGGALFVVVMVEVQSTVDNLMAIRMLVYVALAYEALLRAKRSGKPEPCPKVLPLVLYTGTRPWTAPLRVGALLDSGEPWIPEMEFVLLNEKELVDAEIASVDDLAGAMMQFRHSSDNDMMIRASQRIVGSPQYKSDH